jgi:Gpi18-like mannosyltransferase
MKSEAGDEPGEGPATSRTWLAAILIVAFAIHTIAFCLYSPGDAFVYVIPWYKHVIAHGIGVPVGNYSPPYLYLLWTMAPLDGVLWDVIIVKLSSVVGLLWLVLAAARLMRALGKPWELSLLVFALPSVILDVSMFAQADTFWLAPCLLAVAGAVDGKPLRVAAWAGLAFAVKQQAAWLAPFVAYYLISVRAKAIAWLAGPAAFLLAWLPAWIAGWPLSDLLMIYPGQMTHIPRKGPYIENGASFWAVIGHFSPSTVLSSRWIGLPLAAAAALLYLKKLPRQPSAEQLLLAATFSAALIPFLLPMMHERFFMLADVLAFLFALAFPSRRNVVLAIAVQIASAWPGYVYAFQLKPAHLIAPPIMAAALWAYWSDLTRGASRAAHRPSVPAEAML